MPEDKLVSVPDGISNEVASCITLKGITAEYLLHRAYSLKKGDKILYHAAAGGLGQILCPWANAIGAEVIGTVGSKEKEEIAKNNGCHHVINYTDKNFVEEVEKIVGKNGIDVVYDGVGLKTFEGSIEVLKIRGMMVAFGNASGYVDTIDVKKHINAKGLFFTRPSIAHYTITREELEESAKKVFEAVMSGKFKIEISKKYSDNKTAIDLNKTISMIGRKWKTPISLKASKDFKLIFVVNNSDLSKSEILKINSKISTELNSINRVSFDVYNYKNHLIVIHDFKSEEKAEDTALKITVQIPELRLKNNFVALSSQYKNMLIYKTLDLD